MGRGRRKIGSKKRRERRKRKKKYSRGVPSQSDPKQSKQKLREILEDFLNRTSKLQSYSEIHNEVEKTVREIIDT